MTDFDKLHRGSALVSQGVPATKAVPTFSLTGEPMRQGLPESLQKRLEEFRRRGVNTPGDRHAAEDLQADLKKHLADIEATAAINAAHRAPKKLWGR